MPYILNKIDYCANMQLIANVTYQNSQFQNYAENQNTLTLLAGFLVKNKPNRLEFLPKSN